MFLSSESGPEKDTGWFIYYYYYYEGYLLVLSLSPWSHLLFLSSGNDNQASGGAPGREEEEGE